MESRRKQEQLDCTGKIQEQQRSSTSPPLWGLDRKYWEEEDSQDVSEGCSASNLPRRLHLIVWNMLAKK